MLRFLGLKSLTSTGLVPVPGIFHIFGWHRYQNNLELEKKVQVPSRSDVGPVFFPCVRFSGSKNTNRSEFNKRFGQKNRSENEWVGEVRPRCLHLFKRNKLTALNLR